MFYADLIGPGKVLAKLKEFEATMGEDFKPAALLESVAAENKRFQDL
jgi:3-hydroxyacyl-CoA dehydrogenase